MKNKRKHFSTVLAIALFILGNCHLYAQQKFEFSLWPNGAPNTNGIVEQESEARANRPTNITSPTLTVYVAKNSNGKAIVACPGGGYVHLAMDHEGHDMAAWFNAQGITYAVLKYRMPNEHHEVPLSDALQAIRLVRKHAEEWNIEKVGIMGSSAGGHLASTAATHYTDDSRPDFQILFYPVISMDLSICHKGSRERLIGKIPTDELVQLYSNELQVSAQTPPAFIMHSSDDRVVPVENSLRYYQALVKNKVPASLHCYPTGGHGWGFSSEKFVGKGKDRFAYAREDFYDSLERWLKNLR
jgi:acetyl esterase/lipase